MQRSNNFLKKYYLFIIFFTFSNIGLFPGAPHISSPEVSVTANTNVSLKCLVGVRPSDCWDNSLEWYFSNSTTRLESGEKYDIQERRTNTRCKKEFIITIVNVTYADEGKYKCQWLCDEYYPSLSKSSTIQLKVFPTPTGMNNCVIISSAFSKGVRVGRIFRYKEEGAKRKNFLLLLLRKCKLMKDKICNLSLSSVYSVTRNLSLHFELLFCKETIVQCVVPENIHTPHGGQLGFDRFC